MRSLQRLLRFFFWHFYHGFAWTYDFVAAFVSIGRWNDWIQSVIPFVHGLRILEIGFGPGHLQIYLREQKSVVVTGLDESAQMARIAQRRLRLRGFSDSCLTRGVAQALPFANGSFDSVVSTFPAEYIFELATVQEVKRVLREGGQFVVIPAAWIAGRKTLDRVAAWLFRVTEQAPRLPAGMLAEHLRGKFEGAGFMPEFQTVEVRSSVVLIVFAETRPHLHGEGNR
jgi:ubiquinone/menaquinone biosynthesis C-methylase UbiE